MLYLSVQMNFLFYYKLSENSLEYCSKFEFSWVWESPLPTDFCFHLHGKKRKPQKPTFPITSLFTTICLEPVILFPDYVSHLKNPQGAGHPFLPYSNPHKLTYIPYPSCKLLPFFQCDSNVILGKYPVLPTSSLYVPFIVSFEWKSGFVLRTAFLTSLSSGTSLFLPTVLSPLACR